MRQSNLFAAEDYKKVFKAYAFIDYTAYDFDSLKQALINYIRTYYPEDFNDYIESSEFIAIIELLAYFGTSLAFRTDLNSRENFIDTAERRESIIRLAQMVNYVPRRNVPASGLFKISAVQTDQPLTDANGESINDVAIYWNDPNNPDWFDQFIQVCNASFSTLNPFGRPTKSGSIGSIPTDLYQLNSVTKLNVVYPTSVTISGQQYPIDICNPDFVDNETIFERHPDPLNAFNFIYRNDSLGVGSNNTGFFLYFKQGNLINIDTHFDFPVPNRVFPILIGNINQDDVYAQETDQSGAVISKWLKVPALSGENIIYNSIHYLERNIFDVISGAGDTISIRFADGNFGNVPTGLFRFWTRVSANQSLVIRPDNAQGLQINIPYIGVDQQPYTLQLIFNLEQTIGNAAPAETDDQIKLRAPEVFSTQSRMVNGSDYNVLPLVYGNQISKIQAINRTYSGQSRYIDLIDPTGFHRDLIIFGQDGALFRDDQNVLAQVIRDSSNSGNIETILVNTIQELLRDKKASTFFYDEYLSQFETTIRVNKQLPGDAGYSILDLTNPHQNSLFWKTSPAKFKNDTGYFTNSTEEDAVAVTLVNTLSSDVSPGAMYKPYGFIKSGAMLQFSTPLNSDLTESVSVRNVVQSGTPLIINPLNPYANIGPVELGKEIQTNFLATKIYPVFRTALTASEINEIVAAIAAGVSFWLYYDLLIDVWHTSISATPGLSNQASQPWKYAPPMVIGGQEQIYSEWSSYPPGGLLYVAIASNNQMNTTTYDLTARGRAYVFESFKDVRFFWEPNQVVIDNASGKALQDIIEIMPFVNTNNTVDNNLPIITDPTTAFIKTPINFNISGVFVQDDGYVDSSKIEVSLVDTDSDGIPDHPDGFDTLITHDDRVVFEYYNNDITGYQSTRPWISNWAPELGNISQTSMYVYFPVNSINNTLLYSSPYIANKQLPVPGPGDINYILDPGAYATLHPDFKYVYMNNADLIFVNNVNQLKFSGIDNVISISNQITAFFNGPTAEDLVHYPWLAGTQFVDNKKSIVTNYFINKSYLIAPESPPGFGIYYTFTFEDTEDEVSYPAKKLIVDMVDKYHFDKNGKAFTQNTLIPSESHIPLHFKWKHYAPVDQRVDPSPSNIVDMIVVTDSFYRDVLIWKNSNQPASVFPTAPTTEDLRIQFQDLSKYKMVSDSIVWNSGTFKVLFGTQAEPELQATFKVVKSPSTNMSDNEVKTKVIKAIDKYFDIRNWDFGEKFFYTELAAFIHQQLSTLISSVVIVPSNANSQFGNLFEIVATPSELFISTATVNNVQIVSNLTEQNLRV